MPKFSVRRDPTDTRQSQVTSGTVSGLPEGTKVLTAIPDPLVTRTDSQNYYSRLPTILDHFQ
jgi:hypothetical protein